MRNLRRMCSLLLAILLLFCSGCGGRPVGAYPVILNGTRWDARPEKPVSLSPACTAYALAMGYALYGVSSSCAELVPEAARYPAFGSALAPDVAGMKEQGVDCVIAAGPLLDTVQRELEEAGIRCLLLEQPQEPLGLSAWYGDIGGLFAGDIGQKEGADLGSYVAEAIFSQAMQVPARKEPVTVLCFGEELTQSVPDAGLFGALLTLFDLANVSPDDGQVDPALLEELQPDWLILRSEEQKARLLEEPTYAALAAVQAEQVLVLPDRNIRLYLPEMADDLSPLLVP